MPSVGQEGRGAIGSPSAKDGKGKGAGDAAEKSKAASNSPRRNKASKTANPPREVSMEEGTAWRPSGEEEDAAASDHSERRLASRSRASRQESPSERSGSQSSAPKDGSNSSSERMVMGCHMDSLVSEETAGAPRLLAWKLPRRDAISILSESFGEETSS